MNTRILIRTLIILLVLVIASAWIYMSIIGSSDVVIKNGVYIANDNLLEDITPDEKIIEKNTNDLLKFVSSKQNSTTVAIVPTAIAIKQEQLPGEVTLFNQRTLINDTYSKIKEHTRTVDIYSLLFSKRSDYTYFRTSSHLTGLGGYYLYYAIAPRMGLNTRTINNFEIETLSDEYFGDLSQKADVYTVKPDLFNIYKYNSNELQYMINLSKDDKLFTYHELYPTYLKDIGQIENVLFGGKSDILKINTNSKYNESLLIFSDDTVYSYLPFLVSHFKNITVIDLEKLKNSDLRNIDVSSYSKILFTYSSSSFAQRDLRIDRLM